MRIHRNLTFYVAVVVTVFAVVYLVSSCSPESDDTGLTAREITVSAFDDMIGDAEALTASLSAVDINESRVLAGGLADDFGELADELVGKPDAEEYVLLAEMCGEAFSNLERGLEEVDPSKIERGASQIGLCTDQIGRLAD